MVLVCDACLNHCNFLYSILMTIVHLNDLWRYDVKNSTWTWMSGGDRGNQQGTYGSKGNGTSSTTPGGRYGAAGWYDIKNRVFWVFGGYGYGNGAGQGTTKTFFCHFLPSFSPLSLSLFICVIFFFFVTCMRHFTELLGQDV